VDHNMVAEKGTQTLFCNFSTSQHLPHTRQSHCPKGELSAPVQQARVRCHRKGTCRYRIMAHDPVTKTQAEEAPGKPFLDERSAPRCEAEYPCSAGEPEGPPSARSPNIPMSYAPLRTLA